MSKTQVITPTGNRVLVQCHEGEGVSPGGIVIPDAAKDKPTTGVILDVGPGRRLENGSLSPMYFVPGQTVFFRTYAGSEIEYDGETYRVLSEDDILAVLDE